MTKLPDMEASPIDDPHTPSTQEDAYLKWKAEQEAMLEDKELRKRAAGKISRAIVIGLMALFWMGVFGHYANLPKLIEAVNSAESLWQSASAWGEAAFMFIIIAGAGIWAGWGTVFVAGDLLGSIVLGLKMSRLYWWVYGREPSLLTFWVAWVALPALYFLALILGVLWSVVTYETLFDRVSSALFHIAGTTLWGAIALAVLGVCVGACFHLVRWIYRTFIRLFSSMKTGS